VPSEPVSTPAPALSGLLDALAAHAAPEACGWLERVLPTQAAAAASPSFFGAFAGAGRRIGSTRPALTPPERASLVAAGLVEPSAWSLGDLARAALLLSAIAQLPADRHVALATEIFRKGDSGERVSLLRSLPLLPDAARFTELAAEACRSHVLEVLLAVAHDNPLPARHFPEPLFNMLLMKVLFVEQSLAPVFEWRSSVGADLVRMARDFAAERRAAGRPLPTDLPLLLAMETSP
jgi:hypothetical protein